MGRFAKNIDWITFVLIVCIGFFGLFVLLTVDINLFLQQSLFFLTGIVLAVLLSRSDTAVLWWLGPLFYIGSLIFILIPYFAPEIRGAHRWLFIGPMQIQPSELVKPFIILGLARFIATYSPRNLRYVPLHAFLFVIIFFAVYKQPDFGTAIIYFIVWIGMMLAGGLRLRVLFISFIILGSVLPLFWGSLAEYQKNRVFAFLNPSYDPFGTGYNALQAVIAVGSGELFGRGLGRGTQSHLRFLPEYHTDFIFATLAEEFGFFGGLVLILLYFFLLWRILTPLFRGLVEDSFRFISTVGIFSMIFGQVVVNIGMNMGIVPVAGITLPLVSYGGSSILELMISFGLLWSFGKTEANKFKVATV